MGLLTYTNFMSMVEKGEISGLVYNSAGYSQFMSSNGATG
jgi:hypothetical protein